MEPTKTQLPATIIQAEITSPGLGTAPVVPALIADLGYDASWRYVEFFTANIRNPHTRRAYARACGRFFSWCQDRGLMLTAIRPFDVAAWINELSRQGNESHFDSLVRRYGLKTPETQLEALATLLLGAPLTLAQSPLAGRQAGGPVRTVSGLLSLPEAQLG